MPAALPRLDAAAKRALDAVDERPATQLRALDALEALVGACPPRGVLRLEVRRLLDERRASFKRFHLERAARAADRLALAGESARDEAVRAVRDALVVVERIDDGEGGDVRGLRARLDDLLRGGEGRPRPFFARYLVEQRR